MASLVSLDQADGLCSSRIDDHTWSNAHSELDENGVIKIRFQRWLPNSDQDGTVTDTPEGTFDDQNTAGAWDETDQDDVV